MKAFKLKGINHLILCPGSRSGPIALAANILSKSGEMNITTAIDERSAAFLGVGLSASTGKAPIVVTTSGTAVANLLPAAIEADRSCHSILFISADRPSRLKSCGANQTVNQEDFLLSACRGTHQGPSSGLHAITPKQISSLVESVWNDLLGTTPGPVHLNLAFEEPLHPSNSDQKKVELGWTPDSYRSQLFLCKSGNHRTKTEPSKESAVVLDPSLPGILLVGPWRGRKDKLKDFQRSVARWHELSQWPIFADPISGITSEQPGLIGHWELLINSDPNFYQNNLQVLRLGPMPSSRFLESWLKKSGNKQLVITEDDHRYLDPLLIAPQFSGGFSCWLNNQEFKIDLSGQPQHSQSSTFLNSLLSKDQIVDKFLDEHLLPKGQISEPSLARFLAKWLPKNVQVMLSASSPVRDWLSFSGKNSLSSRCFSFRGASGIDGSLSLAMGIAKGVGPTVLVSGDLALLHDSNGWLFSYPDSPPLVVLLIDNGGGGIFNQLKPETESPEVFERYFSMPQVVDHLALAASYKVPFRQVSCFEDLPLALEWGISQSKSVLIRVRTDPSVDTELRIELRESLINKLHPSSSRNPSD